MQKMHKLKMENDEWPICYVYESCFSEPLTELYLASFYQIQVLELLYCTQDQRRLDFLMVANWFMHVVLKYSGMNVTTFKNQTDLKTSS